MRTIQPRNKSSFPSVFLTWGKQSGGLEVVLQLVSWPVLTVTAQIGHFTSQGPKFLIYKIWSLYYISIFQVLFLEVLRVASPLGRATP